MTKRFNYLVRRIMPVVSAGLLFQAGGCAFDTNSLVAGLASTIANQLISSFVYGAFNIGGP
jgi:hypothetical protein